MGSSLDTAVGGASSFREAVLRAANLGDDADTTAAIAGGLPGEHPGHVDRRRAGDKVGVLVDAGVRTFVDLTTDHRDDQVLALIGDARAAGAVYVHGWGATR